MKHNDVTVIFEQNSIPTGDGVEFVMYIKKNIKKSRAGTITVTTDKKADDYLFVINSNIEKRFRCKGFGKLLYKHAIKTLGKLKTNYYEASDDAQNVWKSLVKEYRHKKDFFEGHLTVYNRPK